MADPSVAVEAPSTFRVTRSEDRETRTRGPIDLPSGPVSLDVGPDDDLNDPLRDAGFDVVDTIVLEPTVEATPPTGVRRRSAPSIPDEQQVSVTVEVDPGEEAVVLVEQDGVYAWVLPGEMPAGTTRGVQNRRFDIAVRATPAEGGTAENRGFVSDLIYSKVTAKVLKFIAPAGVGAIVSHFEKVDEGIVVMSPDGPSHWTHVKPTDVELPAGGRVLLFVHGTFSSTIGSFAGLWATEEGRRFLADAWAVYDQVIGVDHRSLSVDPLVNANEIVDLLRAIPNSETANFDALGYSRGGLVLRSILERVAPSSGWNATFGRAVFVGTTQHGTNLASPEHWRDLIDLYTNLVVAGAGGASAVIPGAAAPAAVVAAGMKVIGAAVKALATELLEEDLIPGLSAMRPGGPFVNDLNVAQPGQLGAGVVDYFAITSDFEPGDDTPLPTRFKAILRDRFMDDLMDEANDLVVNTASMTGFEDGYLSDRFDFGKNTTVFHTNYFSQPDVARALANWWQTMPAMAAPPPMMPPPSESLPDVGGAPPVVPPPPSQPPRRSVRGDQGGLESAGPDRAVAANGGGGDGGGGGSEPPTTTTDEDTLQFSAGMDDNISVDEVTSVEVRIGETVASGEVTATTGVTVDTARPIIVQVMCREGFAPEGDTRAQVSFAEAAAGIELFFDVKATDAGRGKIDVVVRQGAVPIATLSLEPTVLGATGTRSAETVTATSSGRAAPPLAVPLHQLRISERINNGQIVYDFDFESEQLGVLIAASSDPLQVDREEYVTKLFGEIEQRWLGSGEDSAAFLQEMRAYGSSLFSELIPRDIQQALWDHRDEITAIQVLSTEPFVPWEIVHLKEPGGALHPTEIHFLGSMGLVRWLHGSWPPSSIRVRPDRVKAVVPFYPESTQFRLPEAEAELGFMETTFGAGRVDATAASVRQLVSQPGSFDLLHFAGHGSADQASIGQARLMMEGRIEGSQYVPEYISATTIGQFANLTGDDGNHPIVVLNACQVGRLGHQLTSIGGFAEAFTSRGAGAFVSSLWSVGDQPARTFTETWYNELLSGSTVTEATVAARKAAADAGDATWLAYTVYAHPHAVMVPN